MKSAALNLTNNWRKKLHDVNLAIRYADHIFAMREGRLIAQGAPKDVVSEELMRQLYRLDCTVITDPISGAPHIIPKGRRYVTA